MTWFVDEYFDDVLRNMDLCPGVNIVLETDIPHESVSIHFTVFWSAPRLNLNWYPICQIDLDNKTIFHGEGTENPDKWNELLKQAADALDRHLQK